MSNQELDSLLRRVVVDNTKSYTERFFSNDLTFSPSIGYGRQIRLMLSDPLRWAKRRIIPIWKRTLKSVAMIFITISFAIGCLIAVCPPARAAISRWVQEIFEKYISYRYIGETEDYEIQDYEITELPDGYIEEKKNRLPSMVNIVYKNSDENYIFFQYIYMKSGSVSSYVTDGNTEPVDIIVSNIEGTYWPPSVSDGFSTFVWIDPDSNLQFTIDAQLPLMDILHMAESVSLCNHTK